MQLQKGSIRIASQGDDVSQYNFKRSSFTTESQGWRFFLKKVGRGICHGLLGGGI